MQSLRIVNSFRLHVRLVVYADFTRPNNGKRYQRLRTNESPQVDGAITAPSYYNWKSCQNVHPVENTEEKIKVTCPTESKVNPIIQSFGFALSNIGRDRSEYVINEVEIYGWGKFGNSVIIYIQYLFYKTVPTV